MSSCVRLPTRCLHLWGRTGLGDTIYLRPVARAASKRFDEVYVSTAWPELFSDMPVHCVRSGSGLRCQTKNADKRANRFVELPSGVQGRELKYGWKELRKSNIMVQMERDAGVVCSPLRFDLPPLPHSPVQGKYAVVRPVSIREDWPNPGRNPLPEYIGRAASILKESGWTVVSVGDLEDGKENLVGEPIPADIRYERGELDTLDLLALIQNAGVVVGGVGFIVPAVVATQTPAVIVGGGQGACNSPKAVLDPRMDASRVRWIMPDQYCRCRKKRHNCNKTISDFDAKLRTALREWT